MTRRLIPVIVPVDRDDFDVINLKQVWSDSLEDNSSGMWNHVEWRKKKRTRGVFAQLKTTRPRPHHMCLMASTQQGLLAECGPVRPTIFVNKHANHWERPSGSYPELLYTTAEKQTLCCDSPLVYSDLIEDVHNLSVGQSNCLLSSTVITAAIWRTYNCFCGCWHEEKSFD